MEASRSAPAAEAPTERNANAGCGWCSQLKVQSAQRDAEAKQTGRRVTLRVRDNHQHIASMSSCAAAAGGAQLFIGCRLASSARVKRLPWPRQQPCAPPCMPPCGSASLPAGARGSSTRRPCRSRTC